MTVTQAECFHRDLARMNATFEELRAVGRTNGIQFLKTDKIPEGLLSAYCALVSFGYANNYITEEL